MKNIINIQFKSLLTNIVFASFFALSLNSCTKEERISNEVNKSSGETTVTFALKTPSHKESTTRGLTQTQEDAVNTIEVLAFENGTYSFMTYGTFVSMNNFEVMLTKGTYDLIVFANAREVLEKAKDNGYLTKGRSKTEILALLRSEFEGKWDGGTNSGFIMSSDPMELQQEAISENTVILYASLYRMMARINVELSDQASSNFELQEILINNTNKQGFLIGGYDQSNSYTQGVNAIASPNSGPLSYSGSAIANRKSTINEIYIFEIKNNESASLSERPSVIIKGLYNGVLSYYKLDFFDGTKLLDVLRNHSYNFQIKEIKGRGYSTYEKALNSRPMNTITNLILTNEMNVDKVVYNNNYFISISTEGVSFDQFGNSDGNEITVNTNTDQVTLSNFVDTNDPAAMWSNTIPNVWENDRFAVTLTERGTNARNEKVYTIRIDGRTLPYGAIALESKFNIVSDNLKTTVTLTQEAYSPYKIISSPSAMQTIVTDGAKKRIKINVYSTTSYTIEFVNSPSGMFNSLIYAYAEGDIVLNPGDIPPHITSMWIEVMDYGTIIPRSGTFIISQKDAASTAKPITYNVVQAARSTSN